MTRAQQWALLITAAILALALLGGQGGLWGRGLGNVRTERSSAPLAGQTALEVSIRQGAGTLRVDTIDSENAYEAAFTHHAGIRVRAEYARGTLRISDDRPRISGRGFTNDWVVGISRRVPVKLKVSTGAGRGTFDLTGLRGRAEIRSGAGEVRVEFRDGPAAVFTGAASGQTDVEISGGVGRIVVTVPDAVGVRVIARGRLTSRLTLAGFTSRGANEYVNAAWETASAKLEIRTRLGVGEFEVRGP